MSEKDKMVLESLISDDSSLDKSVKNDFLTLFHHEELHKKQYLIKKGTFTHPIAFLAEGILRSFEINSKGEEITTMFFEAPCFVMDISAYLENKTTQINVEALTFSRVYKTHLHLLYTSINHNLLFNKIFRTILEKTICASRYKSSSFLLYTAEERYKYFVKEHPNIYKTIPQYYIASYLGIKPPSLSRIRSRLRYDMTA
ncbi:Crp/Fnr family transcriptional regulator [Aquimarina algicola]|uniref:Crp/Fnr family transcriptional regulator n=1 Tax=Aquimarina algicola TaxID=2589995 RepID=A0A504JHE6_9FLAO|nr:Crp/Fnr family transcriptional regulator [Aquimarina algicola]TPN85870.1 Crp/Fnr family transcriptional regulator [Aquimarina algicola]